MGHFLQKWNLATVSSVAQMEGVCGDSYVRWCISTHDTCNASLALTFIYLQQLQQQNSNGGLLLLTQGCVFANRAETITNERGFLPTMTCALGKSGIACSERLFMIYWEYKKTSGWIFTFIGWLFSDTAPTQQSNTFKKWFLLNNA